MTPQDVLRPEHVAAGSGGFRFRCEFLHKAMLPQLGSPVRYRVSSNSRGALDPRPDATPPTIQSTSPNPAILTSINSAFNVSGASTFNSITLNKNYVDPSGNALTFIIIHLVHIY